MTVPFAHGPMAISARKTTQNSFISAVKKEARRPGAERFADVGDESA